MKFYFDADFTNSSRITNLLDAVSPQDAATLGQVNAAIAGLRIKANAKVATQSTITLNSPGSTIDGITMTAGDRVLVKSQTAQSQNGIYVWNNAFSLTRAADADNSTELSQAIITVEQGTSAGLTYRQTTASITLETTALNWMLFGIVYPAANTSAAGTLRLATQDEVNAGTDNTTAISPQTLAGSIYASAKSVTVIGDGSSTIFSIGHNFNTYDVLVEVIQNTGIYETVNVLVTRQGLNNVTIYFNTAPAVNAYRVIIRS